LPTHFGSEHRTVRVGDTVHRNQPFMSLPDMSRVVVHCQVPEAELSRVQPGAEAGVVPVAYPSVQLEGRVETISSIAQGLPGQEAWRKFFRVVIAIDDADPRLRSGMSVYVQVLSYHSSDSIRIPRTMVSWRQGEPFCLVVRDGREESRRLTVGQSDALYVEVLAGLSPGDRVMPP
jgi:multidrug efflux pump subunit AcrA (membrane-fusion protein)